MKQLCIAILLLLPLTINAQTITTYASGGSGGSGIYDPQNLAFDGAGNLYCPTFAGEKVLKINTAGVITTIAGTGTEGYSGDGGPATLATLYQPSGVATDIAGNVYITDDNNNCVRRIDAVTGIITTIAGNGTAGYSGDGGSATAALLHSPGNVCFDKYGDLYIADVENYRVRRIDTSGIITTVAGTGIFGRSGDGGPATGAECYPSNIAIDVVGNLYIIDSTNSIRKIDTTGIITTIAGDTITGSELYSGDDVPALGANIAPVAIAVNYNGGIFISDGGSNNRVREIDTFGIIHTIAGDGTAGDSGDGGPATAAELYLASGIAFDQCGNLYVAQVGDPRIRMIAYSPPPIALTNILTGTDTICAGTSVTYTAGATASSGIISYQWYVNGILIAGAAISNYIYTPANGDSIRCVATAANNCTSAVTSSNSIYMVVNAITVPAITVTAPAAAAVGSVVMVNATVTDAGGSYSINWYDNGGLFSTTTVPVTTYTKMTGTDDITATVAPVGGCYDSTTSAVITVTVSDEAAPSISPQGGGLSVFPNPTTIALTITSANKISNVTITNIIGQTVQSETPESEKTAINISALPLGVYMVMVTDEEGNKTVKKIVKE